MNDFRAGERAPPLLLRERALILASLVAVSALSWAYLYVASLPASGAGAMAMPASPAARSAAAFGLGFLMWVVMMVGMMLPSAAPMILTFAAISRRRRDRGELFVPTSLFVAGYLLVWAGFSLLAAAVNWFFGQGPAASPLLGGLLFLAAGAYQLTPLKNVCLAKCRSPFQFLLFHWREGRTGALAMGLDHGFYCLLCCWLLMALLFVGGAMNLLWAAAITAFVFIEKVPPQGAWTGRVSGALMIAFGLYLFSGLVFGSP